tara:strand:- start:17507 stop:17839 length:333 start_codon:yes stop_codon:yes gene_type:complete
MSQLIRNAIQTPDGTILESNHRHDFVTHLDKNGEVYGIDGGLNYQRIIGNLSDYTDLTVDDTASFEIVLELNGGKLNQKSFLTKWCSYQYLCEAKFWLGFKLGQIKNLEK